MLERCSLLALVLVLSIFATLFYLHILESVLNSGYKSILLALLRISFQLVSVDLSNEDGVPASTPSRLPSPVLFA